MTNHLHSYLKFLYDVTIIGTQEYSICLQEIKDFWDDNIQKLVIIDDAYLQKRELNNIAKTMKMYLKNKNSMTEDNLFIFKSLNDFIIMFITDNLKSHHNNYIIPTTIGDKHRAIDSIEKLKNDFGLQAILINQTDNWDKVYYWSKNVRRAFNKCIHDFNISKNVLNLNSKLSLQYISPLISNQPQGITFDHKNGYFTVGLKNTEKQCFSAVFIHEMTHVYDRLGAKKYYQDNPQKVSKNSWENKNCLSSILIDTIFNNNQLDNTFLNNFRGILLEMISVESIEHISLTYQSRISEIITPLVELFISSLFDEQFEKISNKKDILEYLTNEMKYLVLSDEKINKNIDYFFDSPTRLIKKLSNFTEIDIESLMIKKDKIKEKLITEIKHVRLNNHLCVIGSLGFELQGFLGNSSYMQIIIKNARKNNLKLNYWTSIEEILARHVEKTIKSNFNHLGVYEVFYPKLKTAEIHNYKILLKKLSNYQFELPLTKVIKANNL